MHNIKSIRENPDLYKKKLEDRNIKVNFKDLLEIYNDKLLKTKQELQSKYIFTVDYRKGSNHIAPDTQSRNPIKDPGSKGDMALQFEHI